MKELRLPNITGKTPDEQLVQMNRFLFNLVQELNWTINELQRQIREGSK